jgi:hypothetical protein
MKDKFPKLPPGVTPSDIDDQFGGEPFEEYLVGATLSVDLIARGQNSDGAVEYAEEKIAEELSGTGIELYDVEIEMVEKQ